MITHKKMFMCGVLLLLMPILGFPIFWKFFLVYVLASILILSSVDISIPRDLPEQFSKNNFFKKGYHTDSSSIHEEDSAIHTIQQKVHAVPELKEIVHEHSAPVSLSKKHTHTHAHTAKTPEPTKPKTRTRKAKNTDIVPPK